MKHLYLKDAATELPVLVWRTADVPPDSPAERVYRRGGFYGGHYMLMVSLLDREFSADAYGWSGPNARTLTAAHLVLEAMPDREFALLADGDQIDVEARRLELAA